MTDIRKRVRAYGFITSDSLSVSGLHQEELLALRKQLERYLQTEQHPAIRMVDALLSGKPVYYAVGQDTTLFLPRLLPFDTTSPLATFLFSGTASMAPELADNPGIRLLPMDITESFRRLRIYVQRGDVFNSSRFAMQNAGNRSSILAWLKCKLTELTGRHRKILVVTYKPYAVSFWEQLCQFHHFLIPYTGGNNQPQPMLPYFGGLTGSNLYQEATCVISLGLNRLEPRQYICQALSLDFTGSNAAQILAYEEADSFVRLDQIPCVLDAQDVSLAVDLVHLVYRSALRRHGETAH